MARVRGRFGNYVTTPARISQVANGDKVALVCDGIGNQLAHDLWARSGETFDVDTIKGRWRIHTRVKSQGRLLRKTIDTGNESFWRDKSYRAHYSELMLSVPPRMPMFMP